MSQKSETVSQKWDCRRKRRLSPNSAIVSLFATVQLHFSATSWTGLNSD